MFSLEDSSSESYKRWLELMRFALVVCANNHVKYVKVNNDGGMFYQKQKTITTFINYFSTSKNLKIFSMPLLRKKTTRKL